MHTPTYTNTHTDWDTQQQINIYCFEGGVGLKESNGAFPGEEMQMNDVSEQDAVCFKLYLFV